MRDALYVCLVRIDDLAVIFERVAAGPFDVVSDAEWKRVLGAAGRVEALVGRAFKLARKIRVGIDLPYLPTSERPNVSDSTKVKVRELGGPLRGCRYFSTACRNADLLSGHSDLLCGCCQESNLTLSMP